MRMSGVGKIIPMTTRTKNFCQYLSSLSSKLFKKCIILYKIVKFVMFFLTINIFCFKTIFKRLYKNLGREKGTLWYFGKKLNRQNVTADIKHFEDCEQLLFSIGKLDKESSKLFCFNSPFGRYKLNRLPFGISNASQIFKWILLKSLKGSRELRTLRMT